MISRFFIDRPIFANVIAIVTILLGAVSALRLPVEQYPAITPPTVRVTTNYPGANAEVVAATVAAPIETQVNGVENMLYMSSTSSGDGGYSNTITFEIGTNLDTAQVLVQNRVAIAEPQLPEEVRRQGVTVKKQSTNIILVISLTSPDDKFDSLFLANYATRELRDELSRIHGVGEVTVFGTANYSMRVWLNAEKLKARNLTTEDVAAALREQNVQVAAGQVGQPPTNLKSSQDFQYTVTTLGRLSDVKQFEDIVVRASNRTQITRLKDIARIELGGQTYDQYNLLKGRPTANIGIFQLPGSNALNVVRDVRKAVAKLSERFPKGMSYELPLDTTKFVQESIHAVYETLIEAGVLVLLVILVFLQDWRALLVPATTVPVTIIGAFFAMWLLGFSINMLTLFGLVLAIGIVVDDAIVVVENAAHHIEEGLAPREATMQAMSEVLGPIIGITLVLMSVFLPSAFMSGITGQLYQQFALTIAATAFISAVNAVTLKPAQCALWLRPHSGRKNFFTRWFDKVYGWFETVYAAIVRGIVKVSLVMMLLFAGLMVLTVWWYQHVPTGFIPTEDQGYGFVLVQLPDAASQDRTKAIMRRIDDILAKTEGIQDWVTIGGLSILDQSSAPNTGTLFITFSPFEERLKKGLTLDALLGKLRSELGTIKDAVVFPFAPPAIRGLGVRGGFEMMVQDRGDLGRTILGQVVTGIVEDARTQTGLGALNTTFRPGVPQLYVDVNREKVKLLDIPLSNVFGTMQAYLGSSYVNDFNKFGRVYQVRIQAEADYRADQKDVSRLEVRNRKGEMVPLSTLATIKKSFGAQIVNRYNMYPAASITGEPAAGRSTGEALQLMEQIAARNIPEHMGYEWTGMAYQERRVGGEAIGIFAMAVVLVYLVLAAQYESWFIPWAVILVVPLGVMGAVAAVSIRGMDNNVYTQIGIVLIIALASKNSILIVEFARELRNRGETIQHAAAHAARMRFRPILMTSFAFILGVVPLMVAHGAGASGQQALGTAVFGGMLASTLLAVFFVPAFFVVMQSIAEWFGHGRPTINEGESAMSNATH
jgi:hydrophobic/amphiphilic exporter-1 (mainly G- bacteria), HAE1 family